MAYDPKNDFTNWEAANGNFTQGNIKDNDGTRNGTPINQKTLNDLYQFYIRLVAKNGVTPNGNPDNQVNNQLMEALDKNLRSWEQGELLNPTLTTIVAGYAGFSIDTKVAVFDLNASLSDEIVTFFTDPHPVGSKIMCYVEPSSGSFDITLNSTNLGANKPIKQAGINGADSSTRRAINTTNGDSFTLTVFDSFILLDQPPI